MVSKIADTALVAGPLGDKLREFLSIEAVRGLANRLNFEEASARQAYADAQLAALAGYCATPPSYTALGFSPKGANVSHADVAKCLAAFGIERPWSAMGTVASAVGSTRLSLSDDFQQIAKRRHKSAHNPASNIPTADLKSHIETSILIAVCFDCLSQAISQCMEAAQAFTHYENLVKNYRLSYRFIDAEPSGTFVERARDGQRVRKRHPDEKSAVVSAQARGGGEVIIVRDVQLVPQAVV